MNPIIRSAVISECGRYRYELARRWDDSGIYTGLYAVFIGLNPSTADGQVDDPTIRRCMRFARDWGYGAMLMQNLFALRATSPLELRVAQDPIGPLNDEHLLADHPFGSMVVACWGQDPFAYQRSIQVRQMLDVRGIKLWVLGLTKNGSPQHPLYLKASITPRPWI